MLGTVANFWFVVRNAVVVLLLLFWFELVLLVGLQLWQALGTGPVDYRECVEYAQVPERCVLLVVAGDCAVYIWKQGIWIELCVS